MSTTGTRCATLLALLAAAQVGCMAAGSSTSGPAGRPGGKADLPGAGPDAGPAPTADAAPAAIESQLMDDSGSAALAAMLAGHQMACIPSSGNTSDEPAGFYPFVVSAADQGGGKTLLSVKTKDPSVGFGYGGPVFDPTEMTGTWTIVSQGDDGRRHLFFQNFDTPSDYLCSGSDPENGGDIVGIVSEVWDAGTISSRGVQCCVMP